MTKPPPDTTPEDLAEILAWLPTTLGPGTTRIDTHGAHVFVGPAETLKIKRPASYAYMDFSTREKRQQACLREIAINRPEAPEIYLAVDRITREPGGSLAFNGRGATLEYAVRMRSFPLDATFDAMAASGRITPDLSRDLGDLIAAMHTRLPAAEPNRGRPISDVRDRLLASLKARTQILGPDRVSTFETRSQAALILATPSLDARRSAGQVKRCHGDLHLANIVLWRGKPLPFDAIEFDEDLATIDPLYDLAFLLMDLHHHHLDEAATTILNRYLWRLGPTAQSDGTWSALRALPLLIALRALVRAVVGVDRARDLNGESRTKALENAIAYLDQANAALAPPEPRLIAVGGLSGSGKSTLAAALAPGLGAVPGAIHLRSDLERKALLGAEETDRIGPAGYTAEMTQRTYRQLEDKAALALSAGYTVITDAVFARPQERTVLEALAARCRVPFTGLWLEAPVAQLETRIIERSRGARDASDATPSVLKSQLGHDAGPMTWTTVAAGGTPAETLAVARSALRSHTAT